MKAVFLTIIILGIFSAFGFKVFVEPRLSLKSQSNISESSREPMRSTSGFAVESSPTSALTKNVSSSSAFLAPSQKEPVVDIATRPDKKAILLTFQNLSGVTAIDYSISYLSGSQDKRSKGKILRSFSEPTLSREIILGACSQGICTYDEGVTSVDVLVTFTLENASTFKFEKTHML